MSHRHCLLSGCATAILFFSAGASAQTSAEAVQAPTPINPSTAPAPSPTTPAVVAPAAPAPTPINPSTARAPSPTTPAVVAPAAPAPAAPTSAPVVAPARLTVPRLGWDINVEGAYGRYFPAHDSFGFGRVRGGLLYSADPVFYALGITYDWSNLENATFGIQAEALHLESGLWAQMGALVDTQVHPGAMFALGWSVLGVELQYRKFDPSDWGFAAVGKIRIPVTFIAKAFE